MERGSVGLPPIIVAAHELKAPLSLIRQLSLALEDASLTSSQKDQVVERLRLTTERALRLTTSLTKAYGVEPSLFPLQPLSPYEVCRAAVYEMTPQAAARGQKIKITGNKRAPLIISNSELLQRILINFIDNAINYSYENKTIQLKLSKRGAAERVRFSLRDYGPAVKVNLLKHIQDGGPHQAGRLVHQRPESSGLGLYITTIFAETLNIKLGAIRHKDGTTFYLDVPISTQLSFFSDESWMHG